jgi:AGZA family xanthine/uracil permease-like MFS transporter
MSLSPSPAFKPKLWVDGDLNAFFGLFTNVLLNVLVLSGLSLYVAQIPAETVYGRILPALGVALPLGNLFYAWLAWRLAKREGRDTVTALPYGPSVPHMFIVVFVVMLPTYLIHKDWMLAWRLGLIWAMIVGVIVLAGVLVGPAIRKYTPRAAMLGTLAGIAIAFIAMRPAYQMFDGAWIGIICFAIILLNWVGGVRLPFGIPGGLAVVLVGSLLGWGAYALGMSDMMKPSAVVDATKTFGLHLPSFSGDVFAVPSNLVWPLLVTAIPLGIFNFTEILNNVESAAVGGDQFDLRAVLTADGVGAILGALLGSPFPPAVYIGHPGWKAMGGRIGYSLATGVCIALMCFLGLTALLLSLIPLVSIVPILLFIGLVIGAQAFQASPSRHAPAVVLALVPNIAEWAKTQVDGALAAAGAATHPMSEQTLTEMAKNGVLYHGMETTGGGAVLAGLLLGAIAAFIIDRRFNWAAVYAFAATVFSYFGLIHSSQMALNAAPTVTFGYGLTTLVLAGLAYRQVKDAGRWDWSPIADDEKPAH